MSEAVNLTQLVNLGAAVAIAVYLVWWVTKKFNSKMEKLTFSIENLTKKIDELILKLEVK